MSVVVCSSSKLDTTRVGIGLYDASLIMRVKRELSGGEEKQKQTFQVIIAQCLRITFSINNILFGHLNNTIKQREREKRKEREKERRKRKRKGNTY